MYEFIATLRQLETTSSRNEKLKVLQEMPSDIKQLFILALNPYLTYKIKALPEIKVHGDRPFDWHRGKELMYLLAKLAKAPAINNELRGEVTVFLAGLKEEDSLYIRRAFLKDLRCGVDVKTFNTVYPDSIPTFDPQAAAKLDDDKIKLSDIPLPTFVDYKYDGYRCLTFVDTNNGSIVYFSKEGREFHQYKGIFDAELLMFCPMLHNRSKRETYIFDGEVTAGSFKEVAKSRGKKNADSAGNSIYKVYHYLTVEEWEARAAIMTQTEVYSDLELTAHIVGGEKVVFGGNNRLYETEKEISAFYAHALEAGEEGVMFKSPSSIYEFKRSRNWIKWKPEKDADGYITAVLPGEPGKGFEHTLGSFTVEGALENGQPFRANCTGFKRKQRDDFWERRLELVNQKVELTYQEATLAEDAEIYSLRFPVFKRLRNGT